MSGQPEIAGWSPSKGIHFELFGQPINIDLTFMEDVVRVWDSWIGVSITFLLLLIGLFVLISACCFRRCRGCQRMWNVICCGCCCRGARTAAAEEAGGPRKNLDNKPLQLRWV